MKAPVCRETHCVRPGQLSKQCTLDVASGWKNGTNLSCSGIFGGLVRLGTLGGISGDTRSLPLRVCGGPADALSDGWYCPASGLTPAAGEEGTGCMGADGLAGGGGPGTGGRGLHLGKRWRGASFSDADLRLSQWVTPVGSKFVSGGGGCPAPPCRFPDRNRWMLTKAGVPGQWGRGPHFLDSVPTQLHSRWIAQTYPVGSERVAFRAMGHLGGCLILHSRAHLYQGSLW